MVMSMLTNERQSDENLADQICGKRRRAWLRVVWGSVAVAVLAPLIGTLGTVFGMVGAFEALSDSEDAKPEALAGDISLAMKTTMVGMGISAISVLVFVVALVMVFRVSKGR